MKGLRWLGFAATLASAGALLAVAAFAAEGPRAISPGSGVGTLVAGACPTFSWGAVPDAESYELVTYEVQDGLGARVSPADLRQLWRVTLPGSASSWTPPANECFAHGGSYAWAIRAMVGGKAGAWSEANLFTIEKAPSAAEVRKMMALMRHYLGERGGAAGSGVSAEAREDAAKKDSAVSKSRARHAHPATAGVRVAGEGLGSLSKKPSAPVLGTPSLSVDANVALGASSNIFKNARVLLWNDTSGNAAFGDSALASVSGTATNDTAVGNGALEFATGGSYPWSGSYNTAVGFHALYSNTTGSFNVAVGNKTLVGNSGMRNTASGYQALFTNTTGSDNTANGAYALRNNTSGSFNVGIGNKTLFTNLGGIDNIALGDAAGFNPTAPADSIFIGNEGIAGDTKTIKIGAQGVQTSTYIAGIRGESVASGDGLFVLIDSAGKLGTAASSRRFKQDIEDMGDVTEGLYALRPVSFRYKQWVKDAIARGEDPARLPHEYGLIAEDVAKVLPDLVVFDKKGRPYAVKYRLLIPMLLNELQREHRKVIEQGDALTRERATNEAQRSDLERQRTELEATEGDLAALEQEDAARQRALRAEMVALKGELSRLETRLAATSPPAPKRSSGATTAMASKLRR